MGGLLVKDALAAGNEPTPPPYRRWAETLGACCRAGNTFMQDVAGYFHMLARTPQNLMARAGGCHHRAIQLLACNVVVCSGSDDFTRFPVQPMSPSSRSRRRRSAWTRSGASSAKSSHGKPLLPGLEHDAPHPGAVRLQHVVHVPCRTRNALPRRRRYRAAAHAAETTEFMLPRHLSSVNQAAALCVQV